MSLPWKIIVYECVYGCWGIVQHVASPPSYFRSFPLTRFFFERFDFSVKNDAFPIVCVAHAGLWGLNIVSTRDVVLSVHYLSITQMILVVLHQPKKNFSLPNVSHICMPTTFLRSIDGTVAVLKA